MDIEQIKHEAKEEEYAMKHPRTVDMSTCVVDDIVAQDYPDFCDAYISYAEWSDGTPLTDDELEELQDQSGDWINQYCLEDGI